MQNALAIWTALLKAGATPIQAAGIMGNMEQESGGNPESSAVDTNGYVSRGLVSWNGASYPNAASLLTGNIEADIKSQIAFLVQTGGLSAASGSTPAEAAQSFMNNYERCDPTYCNPTNRVDSAQSIFQMAKTGNWVSTPAGATLSGPTTPGGVLSSSSDDCAVGWTWPSAGGLGGGKVCVWQNSWTRGLLGGLLIAGGAVVGLVAVGTILGEKAPTIINQLPGPSMAKTLLKRGR